MSSSLASLAEDFRPYAEWLVELATWAGAQPRVTSTTRTHAKQQSLYEAYQQGRSPYPAAPPYSSAHEYGYAFDMVINDPNARDAVVSAWRSEGGGYGGEEDPVHFYHPNWKALVKTEAPTAQLPSTFGTPGTPLEQIADYLIPTLVAAVPALRIFGTAQLATAILSLAGGDQNIVVFWIFHPVEFVRDVFDEWRTLLSLLY